MKRQRDREQIAGFSKNDAGKGSSIGNKTNNKKPSTPKTPPTSKFADIDIRGQNENVTNKTKGEKIL